MFDLQGPSDRVSKPPAVDNAWNDPLARPPNAAPHLVDTTMLFAPKSGGVKRYLMAKRAWFAAHRPGVRHTLMAPGERASDDGEGFVTLPAPALPFSGGYRFPTSPRRWRERLIDLRPSVIEVGDPYVPGHAGLDAGERLGVPVVGFCHSDPAALAALHLGGWAEGPVRERWATLFRRFDKVVAPSQHIAERLRFAGVEDVVVQPLGVDTALFHPGHADRDTVRHQLGLKPGTRLLVFAGRPAREKNIDVLLEAAARLGPAYHLLLIGAGAGSRPQANATYLGYERDPRKVARLLASCDAFVHANAREPFGLVALEAMACGLPMVGIASGGIAEIVDAETGELALRAAPSALAEAITALFERDRAVVGAAARARAVATFGWNATFERLSALYGALSPTPEPTNVIPLFPRERVASRGI